VSADDVLAIHSLIAEYNHRVDAGEADEWAALFTEDGTFDSGHGNPLAGRTAIAEFGRQLPSLIPGARHIATNIWVQLDGDRASARCYLQLWMPSEGGRKIALSGIYHDEVAKTDGVWRFVSRAVTPD